MNKIRYIIVLFMSLVLISIIIKPVYGEDGVNTVDEVETDTSSDWIQKAFQATRHFLDEDISDTDLVIKEGEPGIVSKILQTFKQIVKAINIVLLVILGGVSTISISITGIRYIMSKASPAQEKIARENLHTAIKGMFFGFGAFLIWKIAMSIVQIVISGFGAE